MGKQKAAQMNNHRVLYAPGPVRFYYMKTYAHRSKDGEINKTLEEI
jgi:hypothetical protein